MGLTKTDHFTDRQNKLASLAKALGHPARIAILDYLLKVDTCICGDIVNELPLAQPTVSQHLKELKSAGLIKGNVEGNAICYCINEEALDDLQAYFIAIAEKMRLKKVEMLLTKDKNKAMEAVQIKPMLPGHRDKVKQIYESGIATGIATFETSAPSWEKWDTGHLPFARLVASLNGEVVAWAALSPVSSRCVYGGVAEVSVYVAKEHKGKGIGRLLLAHLITESEANNIWTLQAGIFTDNVASVKIHESVGFRVIGYREKIGKLRDKWKDNYMLERRSKIIGID